MNKLKSFFEKLKKIKHLYVYVAIVFALVLCAVYFSSFQTKKQTDKSTNISTEESTSAMAYATYLENKLCNVLSNLSGVERVSVAITLDGDLTYQYATDTETKTSVSSGSETTIKTETIIVVSNEPVVAKTIYPEIKGVVVVAKGADNIGVKLNILSAVESALKIEAENITILC